MAKFNVYKEDLDSLSLLLAEKLSEILPNDILDFMEDKLYDTIDDVLDVFFDSPDRRNYN